MFNFGWDPEQFASLGSSFDEPDPFAPVATAPVQPVPAATLPKVFSGNPVKYAAMIKDISFDKTPVYDTQDEAVGNLQNFFSGLNNQVKAVDDKYADYNPADYSRSGSKRSGLVGPREEALAEKTKSISSFVKENNIPLTQVRDGVTYYLTTGSENNNNMLHGRPDGGFYKEQGPEGTYSTVYVPPLGMFEDINPLVRAALAVATGGVSEGAMAAAKGLMGETLHLSDYAAMASAGYNINQGNTGMLSSGSGATGAASVDPQALANTAVDAAIATGEVTNAFQAQALFDATVAANTTAGTVLSSGLDLLSGSSLGTAAEGMSALDAANLAYDSYNTYDDFKTAQDKEDEEKAAAVQAAIDITDSANEVVDQTGVTPDPFKPEQPLPEYDLAVEPIVYEPPSTEAGGGGAGEGGETGGEVGGAVGGDTGGVATVEDDARGEGEGFEYDRTQFEDTFGDLWLDADFNTLDSNGDGIVSASEMDEYERSVASKEETDPVILVGGDVDSGGTGAADGSAGGTGTGTGTGAATGTDGTGASTGGSTGAGGATGTGDGTGSGTGTGSGDGSGDGSGSGDGTGDGDGSGLGIGSSGMLNPQRTTDDLFFKELFQMKTQARDTQQIVRAGQPLQTFQQRQRQLQPVDRPRLGMLTDPELLKRYKY